ncbi:MAG: hypothetical protein GY732_04505 [Gammaproteobacteria bacterium]|nr:hypothetical protein [Gammaproteobacteria bacterium]
MREGETGNRSRSQPGLPGTGREGALGDEPGVYRWVISASQARIKADMLDQVSVETLTHLINSSHFMLTSS